MQQRHLGRPKDLKKRQAILDVAKDLFLKLGYEGTNMDAIAKQASVSKLTVYNHFNDKAQLFAAAIEMVCEQHLPKQYYQLDAKSNIKDVLYLLGCHFLHMLYSAEAIKLKQLMSSLASTNIALVHSFYYAGPDRTHKNMYALFEQAKDLKLLEINDYKECTDIFLTLLVDFHYDRVVWQVENIPTTQQIQQLVAQRLRLFLKLYPPCTIKKV